MESDLCRTKLDELIDKLPKKLRIEYDLCKSSDELIDKAAIILKKDRHKLEKQLLKSINSKKYKKDRQHLLNKTTEHRHIFGLSTNPILLNYGEVEEIELILFYYLHEVGHISGLLTKKKKFHSEIVADKFALFWFHKLCIGK